MLQVIKNNFKQMLASPGMLLVSLILPAALFAVALGMFGNSSGQAKWNIAIVDVDHTVLSGSLGDVLRQDANRVEEKTSEEADKALTSSRSDAAVLIPKGFEQQVLSGGKPTITVRSLKGQEVVGTLNVTLNMYIGDLLRLREILGITNGEALAKEYSLLAENGVQYQEKPVSEGKVSQGLSQASGILFYILSMSMMQNAHLILKEKQMGTLNRIRQAPLRRLTFIVAVFCHGVLLLLFNLLSIFLLTIFLFPAQTSLDMYLLWFYYGVTWIIIGIFFALVVRSSTVFDSLSTILTVILAMVGGSYWPLWMMPEMMQKAAVVVPQYWANDAMGYLQKNISLFRLPGHLLALTGFSCLFLALCIFALRRGKAAETFI